MSIQDKLNNAKPTKFFDNDVLNKSIDEKIIVLENALQGALLVPSECTWVGTDVIKMCVDTLKCYKSWELLIRHEVEKEAYQQGKIDAINELVKLVCSYYTMQERAGYYADTNNMIKQRIADFGEQLKEQKNE